MWKGNSESDGVRQSKTTGVWWSVWCYHPVWSGLGIPETETEGQSRRCSYAPPHKVITSYRLADKQFFAFISHCVMSNCKVCTFSHFCPCLRWPLYSPYISSVGSVHIVTSHWFTAAQTIQCAYATMDSGRVDGKEWDSWKGTLVKFLWVLTNHRIYKENYLHLMCCMSRNRSTTTYNVPVYLLNIIQTQVGYKRV